MPGLPVRALLPMPATALLAAPRRQQLGEEAAQGRGHALLSGSELNVVSKTSVEAASRRLSPAAHVLRLPRRLFRRRVRQDKRRDAASTLVSVQSTRTGR